MTQTDYPHLTVATVVERGGRYLFVRERSGDRLVYNQPAGHVEPGESLQQAALRETLEETGWEVSLRNFLGIHQYHSPHNGISYVRVSFSADALRHDPARTLDEDILEVCWLSHHDLLRRRQALRSPMVLEVIEAFEKGQTYPLELLRQSQ